jgi:hypothetical protein
LCDVDVEDLEDTIVGMHDHYQKLLRRSMNVHHERTAALKNRMKQISDRSHVKRIEKELKSVKQERDRWARAADEGRGAAPVSRSPFRLAPPKWHSSDRSRSKSLEDRVAELESENANMKDHMRHYRDVSEREEKQRIDVECVCSHMCSCVHFFPFRHPHSPSSPLLFFACILFRRSINIHERLQIWNSRFSNMTKERFIKTFHNALITHSPPFSLSFTIVTHSNSALSSIDFLPLQTLPMEMLWQMVVCFPHLFCVSSSTKTIYFKYYFFFSLFFTFDSHGRDDKRGKYRKEKDHSNQPNGQEKKVHTREYHKKRGYVKKRE